jgi:prepilin-type N-terminal cleavage/methylation domain-containing protein
MTSRSPSWCASLRGFTLIEVLVALAMTGMLVSVLVSSLFHILRVQDALHDETVIRERQLRERAWFREAIAGCLPTGEEDARAFAGTPTDIRCETARTILPANLTTVTVIRLSLETEKEETHLKYEETGNSNDSVIIARYPASAQVVFSFIDATGKTREQWWAGSSNAEVLPRQVKLTVSGKQPGCDREEVWLAALGATPWLPERPPLPPGMTWDMFKR